MGAQSTSLCMACHVEIGLPSNASKTKFIHICICLCQLECALAIRMPFCLLCRHPVENSSQ
jgi:hypothetical protein